jgi:hypothetical protein
MRMYFTTLYRKLVNYLNDSSALDTGAHSGGSHYCGMYSGLSNRDQNDQHH